MRGMMPPARFGFMPYGMYVWERVLGDGFAHGYRTPVLGTRINYDSFNTFVQQYKASCKEEDVLGTFWFSIFCRVAAKHRLVSTRSAENLYAEESSASGCNIGGKSTHRRQINRENERTIERKTVEGETWLDLPDLTCLDLTCPT